MVIIMAKIDEYKRILGVRKPMTHETAFEDGLKRKAKLKQLRLRLRRKGMSVLVNRSVQREGEIPKDYKENRVKTVTTPQKEAYDLICKALAIHKKGVSVQTLHGVGIRIATIKALMKQRLVQVKEGVLTHYKNEREPVEIVDDWNKEHNTKKGD